MKKYQKLIKDNIDLIGEIESSLFSDIHNKDKGNYVEMPSMYIRAIYISSGALAMIDENYNFDQLPERIASAFKDILYAYVSYAYDGQISHEHQIYCLDLAKEINNNTVE